MWIIRFITTQNSMTSTNYHLFSGISAWPTVKAGRRALTRTSIFFNTHNPTNQYFLTCNLILPVIQLLQTQWEWSNNISICYRKTLPLRRFGSVNVFQDKLSRSFSLTVSQEQKNQRHHEGLDFSIYLFVYFMGQHLLYLIYVASIIKCFTWQQTEMWDQTI